MDETKIISNGEISFTYPKIPDVYTRRIARFADGQVRIWSETWSRWTSLRPLADRFDHMNITWS